MSHPIRIGLIGHGRMGKEILSLLPDFNMVKGAVCTRTPLDKMPWDAIDIIIDFSHAEGVLHRVQAICAHQKPLVLGTTGWDQQRKEILDCFQKSNTPLVWGANFSLGLWIFQSIVSNTCTLIADHPEYDIALLEAHHKGKKDSPSGTTLALRDEIQNHFPEKETFHSTALSPPPQDGIDIATLRVGSIPGIHQVWIEGEEESITLSHSVKNRRTFARGALKAASLLLQYPGVWHIHDLFKKIS